MESMQREVNSMARKQILDKLSIYVPQKKTAEKPVERLVKLAERRDRSVNYLVVEAILQYLKREENRN
jgi:predicted transcriptional regulator